MYQVYICFLIKPKAGLRQHLANLPIKLQAVGAARQPYVIPKHTVVIQSLYNCKFFQKRYFIIESFHACQIVVLQMISLV